MAFQSNRPVAGLDWAAIKDKHDAQLTPVARARSDAMAKAARQGATPAELRAAADKAEADLLASLEPEPAS